MLQAPMFDGLSFDPVTLLQHLVGCGRLVSERRGCLHHDEGRDGDQVVRLEQAEDIGLGHEVAAFVGDPHRQLAWRQFGLLERKLVDRGANIVGDAIPLPARPRRSILQRLGAAGLILVVPAVQSGAGRTDLFQGAPGRDARLLNDPVDLDPLGWGIPLSASPPSASMLF